MRTLKGYFLLGKNCLSYFNDTNCLLRSLIASCLFLVRVVFADSEDDVEPVETGQ